MSVGRSQKTRRESMTENEVLSKGGREGNITMWHVTDCGQGGIGVEGFKYWREK